MSLLDEIETAQMLAGEQAVVQHLERMGLSKPKPTLRPVDYHLPDVDWDALCHQFEVNNWEWSPPKHLPSADELRDKVNELLIDLAHAPSSGWLASGRLAVFDQPDGSLGLFVGERGRGDWKPFDNAPRLISKLQDFLAALAAEVSPFDKPAFDPVASAREHFPEEAEATRADLVTNYFTLGQEAGRIEVARELLRKFFPFNPANWKHKGTPYADKPVNPEHFGTVSLADLAAPLDNPNATKE